MSIRLMIFIRKIFAVFMIETYVLKNCIETRDNELLNIISTFDIIKLIKMIKEKL